MEMVLTRILPRSKFNRILVIILILISVGIPLSILAVYDMNLAESAPQEFAASFEGREHEVEFHAIFKAPSNMANDFAQMSDEQKDSYVRDQILPLMEYTFGPLVERNIGSPQRVHSVIVDWATIRPAAEWVELPYTYKGVWLVNRLVSSKRNFSFPIPFNEELQFIDGWRNCTDSAPDHQTQDFFWYFWDPNRPGCGLKEGVNFQNVQVDLGKQTPNRTDTRPEHARLREDGELSMTIAFGYVEDAARPRPDTNTNAGVSEYRKFLASFERTYGASLTKEPIARADYPKAGGWRARDLQIGTRFTGELNGLKLKVNVVVAAGIDQMDLFAKSYAHDEDDVFMWFGHSRVGSGFDADRFAGMLSEDPSYFRTSKKYQVVYWGGCNSYSYYTLPFFELKAGSDPSGDPNGTRNLDIIANGMPSFFSLNAKNAALATRFFLEPGATYFELTKSLEGEASRMGTKVLVTVMGDEDNG